MTDDPLGVLAGMLPGEPGVDGYFPTMALSTVDEQGDPDVRTVLLSTLSTQGLAFHTDARSNKVAQLADRPRVALMINLPEQARQIVVRGEALRQNASDAADAFRSRPRYLQLLAWRNTAELAVLDEPERRRRWAEFAHSHPEGSLTAPPEWVGFTVRPSGITFWQGHSDQPSKRIVHTRSDAVWTMAVLPG
ncbi:pyridoxamine 5'-phosphate oxidase [Nakamurella sp. UYEF19]|uniref:pyridoxine/pyridoxamine 5'-phosphate oxidase n=1 Tax=Nakamurella sp. UYEF19 TaxID=1756392 RepID=UPI003394E52B